MSHRHDHRVRAAWPFAAAIRACLCVLAVLLAWPQGSTAEPPYYVADEIIVRYRSSARPAERAAVRARVGGVRRRDLSLIHGELVKLHGRSVPEALEAARHDGRVEYAEPNYYLHVLETVPLWARAAWIRVLVPRRTRCDAHAIAGRRASRAVTARVQRRSLTCAGAAVYTGSTSTGISPSESRIFRSTGGTAPYFLTQALAAS